MKILYCSSFIDMYYLDMLLRHNLHLLFKTIMLLAISSHVCLKTIA